MSFLFRTASVLNVGASIALKTLKYVPINHARFASAAAFGMDRIVKLDTYESRRKNAAAKLKSAGEELRLRIVTSLDTMNAINSRDIQELIFTAEKEDVELVIAALKKLQLQSGRMRFSDFNLDAVVMRMFSFLELPEEASKAFLDDDFKCVFVGYNSLVILLDLLYRNGLYQNILDCIECLEGRQNFNVWASQGIAYFYLTACLKMNTPESLDKGIQHYDKILKYRESAGQLKLLCSLLALKGNSEKKLTHLCKLLDKNKRISSDIKTNIFMQQLTLKGKLSDALEYLKHNKCVLAKDTCDLIVAKSKETDSDSFDKISQNFEVHDLTLEEWIIEDISRDSLEREKSQDEKRNEESKRNRQARKL